MYEKNDLSKYYKTKDIDELLSRKSDTFRRDNSVLNSTAYYECKRSLGSVDSSYLSFREFKKTDIKTKAENFKQDLTKGIHERMDRREFRLNNNIDILNLKFRDINPTTPVMTTMGIFINKLILLFK